MNRFLFVAVLLTFANFLFGQVEKGVDGFKEAKDKAQIIVDHLKNDEVNVAFEKIGEILILPEDEIDNLETQTIKNLNLIEKNYGSVIGSKLVKEELVEDVLFRLTYVVKYEIYGVRYIFTYYNGLKGKWYLVSFKWDDSVMKLLDE